MRRLFFVIIFVPSTCSQPVSPISDRHSWSTRNVNWRGRDTSELRSRPDLADVRHASVERGEREGPVPAGGMPVSTDPA